VLGVVSIGALPVVCDEFTAMNRASFRNRFFGALWLVWAVMGGLASVGTAGGCYSHVTQARGPGAERYKVYDRNTDDIILGKWFGEPGRQGVQGAPK